MFLSGRMGLAMLKELIECKPDVLHYLAEQDGRDIAALMERHRCASAICVSKLFVRTPLTDFRETEGNKNGDDLARFENGDVPHCSGDRDVLHADKLGLQIWLTVFEKHGDDFLEVVVQLVERLALRVGARKAGDKSHKEICLGAAFDHGGIGSHDWLQLREWLIIDLAAATCNRNIPYVGKGPGRERVRWRP
jgi:hypothetical protein